MLLYSHRYRRSRLLTHKRRRGLHDKSKMAVQQGKKTIDSQLRKSGFLQFLLSHCFKTYSVKFYGKEKLSAKILRIYMIELDENSQNYPSIKVRVKWSLGQFERFIARNTVLC